ncbi:hypothetical protein JT321_gp61 [Providencia phage Kokobel1]|uniref:Uncharacterized protein n=1 Tax=Providencia phage Kokobel1 TaxID=2783540 RepID=A0A873WQU8_9CAUD|nr:hypothetical protein JT321_gp61 [Providencia phage Kokobel1]QPB11488.1 hypothetical protein [Providencia phage Kokobel1]
MRSNTLSESIFKGEDVAYYSSLPKDTNSRRARSRLSSFLKPREKELQLSTHDIQTILNLASAFYFRADPDPDRAVYVDSKTIVSVRIPGMVEDDRGWLVIRRHFMNSGQSWKTRHLQVIFIHSENMTVCDCEIPLKPD